jgi:hypothetical protein
VVAGVLSFAWLSLAAGAIVGVEVAGVVVAGEEVAAWLPCDDCSAPCGCGLSFAAFDAVTITVRDAVPVRPLGSVTV